jgi:hypothetical protein
MLILDLILSVIDLFADDTHTLCQCSLVSKQWLLYARHRLFNDLTIKLCVRPIYHQHCRQCVSRFAYLVASRYCTIPHSIHTLTLSGNDIEHSWSRLWSFVGNAGGMDRPEVVTAVMRHFQPVERLEMIDLHWFNPSWRSSRTVARFLSSVKSLTLDEVGFYGSPRALLWMLSNMPNLEVLLLPRRPDWPARRSYSNNPHALLALISFFCPPPFFDPF